MVIINIKNSRITRGELVVNFTWIPRVIRELCLVGTYLSRSELYAFMTLWQLFRKKIQLNCFITWMLSVIFRSVKNLQIHLLNMCIGISWLIFILPVSCRVSSSIHVAKWFICTFLEIIAWKINVTWGTKHLVQASPKLIFIKHRKKHQNSKHPKWPFLVPTLYWTYWNKPI